MKQLMLLRTYGPVRFIRFAIFELYRLIWMQRIKQSYSQKGEDLILDRLLGYKKNGMYVDIGANDPVRFSNTYRFYKRGWRGILVEPDRVCYKKLKRIRPHDIAFNKGVGSSRKPLSFFIFFPDTLSTFSKDAAKRSVKQGFTLVDTVTVPVEPLYSILDTHGKKTPVDILSVDTEGYDLTVLKSNNWDRFRPRLICVEGGNEKVAVAHYLVQKGYSKVTDNGLNSIYKDTRLVKP